MLYDVKPEGALLSVFYAEASKGPHTRGKYVTFCGLYIITSVSPIFILL